MGINSVKKYVLYEKGESKDKEKKRRKKDRGGSAAF
jgi:hypothetical protein